MKSVSSSEAINWLLQGHSHIGILTTSTQEEALSQNCSKLRKQALAVGQQTSARINDSITKLPAQFSLVPYDLPNNSTSIEDNQQCWGYISSSMCKALDSTPSTTKTAGTPLCLPLKTGRVKIPS